MSAWLFAKHPCGAPEGRGYGVGFFSWLKVVTTGFRHGFASQPPAQPIGFGVGENAVFVSSTVPIMVQSAYG